MEFDQAFSGPFDWNFPSPTATPTNTHFSNNVHNLQTPKTIPYPTHFQDAFNTPQLQQAYTTPQQNHFNGNSTSMHRPQTSSEYLSSSFYANMPPPAPMPGYDAAPVMNHGPAPTNPQHPTQAPAYMPTFDTAQMQTPPPTRGTPARKAHQGPVAFGTPSTIASRRFMTPQQQVHSSGQPDNLAVPQHTPVQFPQLQISPDMYHFGNFGPASAPVVPSSQILWGNAGSPGALPTQKPLDDPFAPSIPHHAMLDTGINPRQGNPNLALFDTPAMRPFPVQAPLPRPSSAVALSSLTTSRQPILPSSVDPSLVYSSPQAPPPVARSASARKPALKRNDSANATATLASGSSILPHAKPGTAQASIRRSSSTTAASRAQASLPPTATPVSRSNSVSQPPRTASPLKRVGKTPLGAISENRSSLRRSVVLTVDENGRAVARKVDDSPTKSMRARYPGLFDSDSSDDEDGSDSSEQQPPSRTASFSFAKGAERKPKAARLDPPVENLQGLNIPRSGSAASLRSVAPSKAAVAAVASLRRNGSVRKGSNSRAVPRRNITISTGPTLDVSPMDAGSALDIDSHSPNSIGTAVDSHISWPGEDMNTQSVPYPSMNNVSPNNPQNTMISADMVQMQSRIPHHAAPMSVKRPAHVQHHNPLIRCPCGDSSNSQVPLVQCVSCNHWLHSSCIGLHPQASPPPNFVCIFCVQPAAQPQMLLPANRV